MPLTTFFRKLVPQEKKFYPLFESLANCSVEAAINLTRLFAEEEEVKRDKYYRTIKELEVKGDRLSREIFDELDRTFITPFEREDVHALSSSIEGVLDLIYGCSTRIELYKPRELDPEFSEFPNLILLGCQELQKAVGNLKDLRNHEKIRKACSRITDLEKQGDDLNHLIISTLFRSETDAIELIKKKEIAQVLEKTMDEIEDAGDVCRTILIKMV